MEQVEQAREKAKRHIIIADRMLTQTYPLLNDPKLFIAVIENLFLGVINQILALIYSEKNIDKSKISDDNPDEIIKMFNDKESPKYDLEEYEPFIGDVKQLRQSHKKASVEFSRKDSYVVCSKDYECETLSEEKLKSFIKTARLFIKRIEGIIEKNERIHD